MQFEVLCNQTNEKKCLQHCAEMYLGTFQTFVIDIFFTKIVNDF